VSSVLGVQYDIYIFNRNWADTQWQQYNTHLTLIDSVPQMYFQKQGDIKNHLVFGSTSEEQNV
jgi:hypothetical protein